MILCGRKERVSQAFNCCYFWPFSHSVYFASHDFEHFLSLLQPTWITQCPLLLLDTRMPYGSLLVGCGEHLDPAGTGSFYNEGEADIAVQHVFSLIYAGIYT